MPASTATTTTPPGQRAEEVYDIEAVEHADPRPATDPYRRATQLRATALRVDDELRETALARVDKHLVRDLALVDEVLVTVGVAHLDCPDRPGGVRHALRLLELLAGRRERAFARHDAAVTRINELVGALCPAGDC